MVTPSEGPSDRPDPNLALSFPATSLRLESRELPHSAPVASGPGGDDLSPDEQGTIESRDAFLDAISHELRSPITTLRLSTQLLLREFEAGMEGGPERGEQYARMVDRQAEKLMKLVAYLLDVSRSGTGALPLDLHQTDIIALIEAAVEDAQALTKRHQIHVVAPAPVNAVVDAARIEQVLVNLLDNSVKYSPDGGEIAVEVTRSESTGVRITVTDHGVGVPPDRRARMFDRFSGLHDAKVRGLGLGLYLSRRLVQLHGGTLTADFPPGTGTRLIIDLPETRSEL